MTDQMVQSPRHQTLFDRAFGASEAVAPVWPKDLHETPVRHPSRARTAYRPRGLSRLDLNAQERSRQMAAARGQAVWPPSARSSVTGRAPFIRRAAVAGIPILGLGLLLAGYGAVQTTPPGLPLQSTTSIATPVPAASEPALLAPSPVATLQAVIETPPPSVLDRAPLPPMQLATQDNPPVVSAVSEPSLTMAPPALAASKPDDAFVCILCATPLPPFEGVTIALHADIADLPAFTAARAVLSAQDYAVTTPQIAVVRNQVRFYRPADAANAQDLAARFNASVVDLTWFAPDGSPARIDLFLTPSDRNAITHLNDHPLQKRN